MTQSDSIIKINKIWKQYKFSAPLKLFGVEATI
jgi:hypothetical protein